MAEFERILIVEDDSDLAEMLRSYFSSQGYAITVTHFGEEAVAHAIENPPDLALLDIRLPDINGYQVCNQLRSHRQTANLPIIFLTERRERDDKLAGLALGAVDYITKPFDIKELRLRVRNALRRKAMAPLVNPVTNLPEGPVVKEKLEKLFQRPDWGVVLASIRGLNAFRDQYGFVAADDAARAIGIILKNAMQETGIQDEFLGHLDAVDFVVTSTEATCPALMASCRERLDAGVQYFYPAPDRDDLTARPLADRLHVHTMMLRAEDGDFGSIAALRTALLEIP